MGGGYFLQKYSYENYIFWYAKDLCKTALGSLQGRRIVYGFDMQMPKWPITELT